MSTALRLSLLALASATTAACAPMGARPAPAFEQSSLPEAVRVAPGHRVAMETVGAGRVTYECRERSGAAGFEWAFVGPEAQLTDRAGRPVGRYYGPPATWESTDGSKVTARQVAVAPAGGANLPLQLVRAEPASGPGVMQGTTYIQRVATRGGVAPALACDAAARGARQSVDYQADYIFWKEAR